MPHSQQDKVSMVARCSLLECRGYLLEDADILEPIVIVKLLK